MKFSFVSAFIGFLVFILAVESLILLRINSLHDKARPQVQVEQMVEPSEAQPDERRVDVVRMEEHTDAAEDETVYDGEIDEVFESDPPGATLDLSAPTETTVSCGYEGCFEEAFQTCEEASMEVNIADWVSIRYEIFGPGTDGCDVEFVYTVNPNPDWVNQPMVCDVDNSIPFEEAYVETFNGITQGTVVCEGPLYDILTNG